MRLTMLDRDIDIFRTVMTSGSASKAARLLGLSQPAVSLALRRLEKHAGLELFQRAGGKLRPNGEAHALLAEVQRHYVGMDLIEHRIRTLSQFGAGRVRIASFPGLGVGFVPRVLADLGPERERSLVSLQVMGSQDVRDCLLRGEAEFGLVADDVSVSGLEHALFAHYFGVVALPAGHALAAQRVITPGQLARHPFISLNPGDTVSVRLDAICRAHGVQLRTVVESSFTINLCELVRAGIGISLVNPVTACDYLHAGIVFRPFSERLAFTALTALPPGQPSSPLVRALPGAMRKRLQADMNRLATHMGAPDVRLHQFQKIDGADV
jgi:DNA-binding transcriptional LysR family regulator